MKKFLVAAVAAFVLLGLNSCLGVDPVGTEAQLYGRWQNTKDTTNYRVYSPTRVTDAEYKNETGTEKTESYYWGKEWTESEGVFEDDLVNHGNGWFMWRKVGEDVLELQCMDNHGAIIEVSYKLTTLNDSVLSFKTESGRSYTYHKIANR